MRWEYPDRCDGKCVRDVRVSQKAVTLRWVGSSRLGGRVNGPALTPVKLKA
jgi:hypothetical protein